MKKLFYYILFLILILPEFSHASHYMGGEITWECMTGPSYSSAQQGRYRFHLKLYRECYSTNPGSSSATFGTVETLMTTVPGLANISMGMKIGWPKDISTSCNNPTLMIKCVGGSAPNNVANSGAVSEYYYTSDAAYPNGVQLSGVPPSTGWMFYNESCCRNPSTNITAASSLGYRLRAIMYPYVNQNTYPCFDNSPTFAEPPKTVICSGTPFTFSMSAIDKENDSLRYGWGQTWDQGGTPIYQYSVGYSYLNPLPGPSQNANNISAVLNPTNGDISFTSFTIGAFVTCTKISSYKSGIKVAEIYREMQIVLSNCGSNLPPQIISNSANVPNIITDTATFGDTVNLSLYCNDSLSTIPLKYSAIGSQFGTYVANPPSYDSTGCNNPPGATLTNAGNQQFPYVANGFTSVFNWVISPNHLPANTLEKLYTFKFDLDDDACPIPARKQLTLNVLVRIPYLVLNKPILDSLSILNSSGNVNIFWTKPTDPNQVFSEYQIYSSENYNGPYTLVQTINTYNTQSCTDNSNAGIKPMYYFMKIKCDKNNFVTYSQNSDTLVTKFYDLKVEKLKYFEVFSNPTVVEVMVKNTGNQTFNSFRVQYDIPGVISKTDTINQILLPGATLDYFFTPITLSTPTNITLCGSVLHNLDYNSINNMICNQFITGVESLPNGYFGLKQNIPNPTKGKTLIQFEIPVSGEINFEIRNLLGQIILQQKQKVNQGINSLSFDLSGYKEGVYFYSIEMFGLKQSKRLILLK